MVSEADAYHLPVLLQETLRALAPQPGETMLDATLGGGGHSLELAKAIAPGGTLIGLDRDTEALEAAQKRLALLNSTHIILLHTPFGNMNFVLDANESTRNRLLDGVLFDLGVSSHQLDTERGFSFRRDEFLDMRMDTTTGTTAAQLLATVSEAELNRILWDYGEERWSKRITQTLMTKRRNGEKVETTRQLAELVEQSVPRSAWPRDIHVATRTFQGLRIAVNAELDQLEAGLEAAITLLAPGGRIAVISFHSLEDRIVKQTFAREAGRIPSPPGSSPAAFLPDTRPEPRLELQTRKPVLPTEAEIARNPRARSARLRAATRIR